MQSAMIGGGYATGRELIEFFLTLGPWPAIVAMLTSTVVISVVCAVMFEFSRRFELYDYRLLFKKLLGPAWVLFEIAFLALILLILSVIGAASNELLQSLFTLPAYMGSIVLMAAVGTMVFWGPRAIRNLLSSWSILLYLTYGALIVWSLSSFGDAIVENLTQSYQPLSGQGSLQSGLAYAGYNLVVVITALFLVRNFKNDKEALWAGVLCGPLCMIPGVMLIIAMIAHYPAVISESLPVNFLLDQLSAPGLLLLVQVVIFGTFIETGVALLHAVNERLEHVYAEHSDSMPRALRPAVALAFMIIAVYVADLFGIIDLVAKGYTFATYLFWAIMVIPILTRGIWLIWKDRLSSLEAT